MKIRKKKNWAKDQNREKEIFCKTCETNQKNHDRKNEKKNEKDTFQKACKQKREK